MDVIFDRDFVQLRPVDAVGMWTVLVKSYPMSCYSPYLQLVPLEVLYPCVLAPLGYITQVRLHAGEALERCDAAEHTGQAPILEPD